MSKSPPAWVQDAIFYQIFPDRFARSARVQKPGNLESWDSLPTPQGFKGGDLLGIVEHLDYLEELGVNGLYLNPIFQATSNHRYNTHDYFQVDPLLGGHQAFSELLAQAHRRGMRVILDGVFNHTGRSFLQFANILENGQNSTWLDWYGIDGWPISPYDTSQPANYRGWHNLRELPELNLENPEVREFIYRVGEYWLAQGIDGWRLDSPDSVKVSGFWEGFRRRMKDTNSEAVLFGEIWRDTETWLKGGHFDGITNYVLTGAILAFAAGERVQEELIRKPNPTRDYYPAPPMDAVQFADRVEGLLQKYPQDVRLAQLNLLDSHDTPRILTMVGGDLASVKLAFLFQIAYPGAPCIYYGDEIGLSGGPDPDCRRSFPWDQPECWDRELLEYYQRLIHARRRYSSLRRGAYTRLYARGMVYAFARHMKGRDDKDRGVVIAVLNAGESTAQITLPVYSFDLHPPEWRGHISGQEFVALDDVLHLEVPARQGELLA